MPEDPRRPERRTLRLRVIVHRALRPVQGSAPVFVLVGGPGQAATRAARGWGSSSLREHHDIVLLDQRGTSDGLRLDCALAGSPMDPQGYLDRIFEPAVFQRCRVELGRRADLRYYSSELAADDLDALRKELGAPMMNLHGTSYGTRLALEVVRRHPGVVRAVYLASPVPIGFKNPLFHARAAQDALDSLVADCGRDAACRATFPRIREDLDALVARLRRGPVTEELPPDVDRQRRHVKLSLENVGEALRVLMYAAENASVALRAVHRAADGDFSFLAGEAVRGNRRIRESIAMGLLQSVICNEDIPRITEDEIVRETRGTMLGDSRVRSQAAACEGWPRSALARTHGEDVRSASIPVLVVSGNRDPVTPVRWGDQVAGHFRYSRHLVVPGGHAPWNACVASVMMEFFARASVASLDTSCVRTLAFPPLAGTPDGG